MRIFNHKSKIKDRQYYTVSEVAEEWNVSLSTVYAWVAKGLIPHLKIGKTVRIPKAPYEQWKKEQLKVPTK